MRVVIFGLGSIGKRHAEILSRDFNHELFAYRSSRNSPINDLGIKELYTWREITRIKPDAAFITNPTYLHIRTALQCASRGMHIFMEKPLSNSMRGIDRLCSICRKRKLICYTAYGLRFHPVVKEIAKLIKGKKIYHARITCSSYLPDWRKGRDFKKVYSACKNQGGGVLLDLSHECDYIQYLFGPIKEISGNFGRISSVTVDAEDFADVLIKTYNSIPVNLHLNFLSLFNERRLVVDYEGGYLAGDLMQYKLEHLSNNKLQVKTFPADRNKFLKEQIKYFFDNIGSLKIMNNLNESKSLLKKILTFKQGRKRQENITCGKG